MTLGLLLFVLGKGKCVCYCTLRYQGQMCYVSQFHTVSVFMQVRK